MRLRIIWIPRKPGPFVALVPEGTASTTRNYQLLSAPTPLGPWSLNNRPLFTNYYNYDYEVVVPSRDGGMFYKLHNPAN